MRTAEAYLIFRDIENPKYTVLEKGAAIREVLQMPTHNTIPKTAMLAVIRWLWEQVFEEENDAE